MSLHAIFRNLAHSLKVEAMIKKDLAALIDNNWAIWSLESNMASTILKVENDEYRIEFILNENAINNPDRVYEVFVHLHDATVDFDSPENIITKRSFGVADLTPENVANFIARAIL